VKLPAVCLAATFSGGVALGLYTSLADLNSSVVALRAGFSFTIALLLLSAVLLRKEFVRMAACFSLGAWLALGTLFPLAVARSTAR
jgi:hypothetical protein